MDKLVCSLLAVGFLAAVHGEPSAYDNQHVWVYGNLSVPLPGNAMVGGIDPSGFYTYIGRIKAFGNVLPARVFAETGIAYGNTNSSIYKYVNNYDLLTASPNFDYKWIRSYDGMFEPDAVSVGTTHWNERVFICRAMIDGCPMMGTLFLSQKGCRIRSTYLITYTKYEILVAIAKSNPID